MNAYTQVILTTRQEWWKIVSTYSRAEKEPKYRRVSRRYTCSGEIKVTGEIDDEPFRQTCALLQISAEGITARARQMIPNDIAIMIHWHRDEQDLVVLGKVVHCTQTIGGYKLGIQLEFSA